MRPDEPSAPPPAERDERPPAAPSGPPPAAPSRPTPTPRPDPPPSSPRPSFDRPTLIRRSDVTRHVWGDAESGEVLDWIYASTERIHMLVFGLPPGGAFRHSDAYRTVFAADELLYVLEGTLVLADPEHGEVQRVAAGQSVLFRRDTWHHAFALGPDPLRVLELFAPPPAAGASSAYAREQPYLETSRYADDAVLGHWPPSSPPARRFRVLRPDDVLWRRDVGVLCGILASTEHLTAARLEIGPGERSTPHAHGGDAVVLALDPGLWVRAWFGDAAHVFELGPEDACFLPAGSRHEYRNASVGTVRALCGAAPRWLP
jgi:quercetin dioxygenase-like cupin family protein